MFETLFYQVARLDGDYAYLNQINVDGTTVDAAEEKCVARALLPSAISEGTKLVYEMLEYSIQG